MSNEEKGKSSKFQNAVIIGLSVVIVVMVSGFYLKNGVPSVYTNDAVIDAFSVDVSPDILARIISLEVDEGDILSKGQLISVLQNDILLAQRQESEANIAKLFEALKVEEAIFEKVKNDYIRAERGVQDQVITFQEFDHRQKDFEAQMATVEFARANLLHAQKMLGVIHAELDHTVIVAPIDGVVAKRWVYTGDVMNPGQTMFTLNDLKNVWVLARLEEKKIRNVKIGDSVEIHVDAYPGYTFHGKVFVIKGSAASKFSLIPQDNATGNYTKVEQRIPIKITIEKPRDFPTHNPCYLLPGMSVEVKIFTSNG